MGKHIKTIGIIIIGFILIAYVGYKLGLYPVNEKIETVTTEKESLIDIVDVEQTDNSSQGLLQKIYDNLDSGMESNDSKKEEGATNLSNFEKSLECFYVTKVVDGDTIWVSNDNHPDGIKVRYIGIDTPESVADEEKSGKKNTDEGVIASERNKEIIEDAGFDVYLEYDKEKEDDYGRTLAYVYVLDFESGTYTMIEEILLKEGLCQTMTIKPNTKYEEAFNKLQSEAKKSKIGFWGTGFYN